MFSLRITHCALRIVFSRGAIFTGGKGSLDNVIEGTSAVTIGDKAKIDAKTVNIYAKNYITTDKYSDEYDYTLFGRMGGVVDDVDYQRSTATTKKYSRINIGNNAVITTTGAQLYDAGNDFNLKNNVYGDGGSLLASLRWIKSHNYITMDEKITVGNGSELKNEGGTYNDGGITLTAHDNLEHNPYTKGFSKSVTSGNTTITSRNTNFKGKSSEEIFAQQIYNDISTATTDYANDYLVKRHGELTKLLGEYSDDNAAASGLRMEITALENEMIDLGMGSYKTDSYGVRRFILGATPSIQIKAVILPNIEVSGGSINVTTDNFSGKGRLAAQGVPKIDVENSSSAYLVTQKLTIGDKGGTIKFNGTAVSKNSSINDLNRSSNDATFRSIQISDSDAVPTITVVNSYAGQGSLPMKPDPNAPGYDQLDAKAKTASYNYVPINYIEVTDNITNPVGKIVLNNTGGSIRINSGANVNGQDVDMKAKNSISQGFNDGIVHIAYTPEFAYADEAKRLRNLTGWDAKMPTTAENKTYNSDLVYNGGTGRIAGDSIYIAARDININGTIQAGFAKYNANVTQSDVDKASEQAIFNGIPMYKVNNGGIKFDTSGYYYEPQIYFDKSANKLYVEDIKSNGGKIYLSGRILSTGNGKILVSDGAANIDIMNNSSYDLNVGGITNSSGNGFIQIIDTAQDKLTEYSNAQTRTIENYSAWTADPTKGKVTLTKGLQFGENVTYAPKKNLVYRWAEGLAQSTTSHYHKEEVRGRWGNDDDPNYTGRYEDMTNTHNEISKPEKVDNPLGKGNFIFEDAQSENFKMYATNSVSTTYGIDRYAHEYTTSGFFGYYHHHQHYWNKTIGTKQIYVYSLKADYPISVGMIGEKNPAVNASNIKLESENGAIDLQIESNGQPASSTGVSAISAAAHGDIKLTKNDKTDFRIGSIVSTTGDVEMTADAYLAADNDYQTLVATVKNPQYDWTAEDLLYGIRSAIVNKQEGSAVDVTGAKDANITARNVTLTGAGIGSNSKTTTTIELSAINRRDNETAAQSKARLNALNTLANAEAADVKLNYALDANGNPISTTITRVNYNYDADKGYYIDKAGNYIRYRNDAAGNLMKFTYDKDLNQIGTSTPVAKDSNGNYDFSDVIIDTTQIVNRQIKSFEISGTVPIGINATGNISIQSTGNDGVYIVGRNKGVKISENNPNNNVYSPLNISSIATKKSDGNYGDVRVIGAAGIFSVGDGTNITGKDLILVGGSGSIGTKNNPLTVSLSGDLLNARSNDEINLQKRGNDNFRISAIYSPKDVRISNTGGGFIEHSKRFDEIAEAYINSNGTITLSGNAGTADNPILILPHENTKLNLEGNRKFYVRGVTKGTINLNDISGYVDITSEGSIRQTPNGKINPSSIKFSAAGDVILDRTNQFSAVNIGAIGGKFELKNDSDRLRAIFNGELKGEVDINQRGDIALEGSVGGSTVNITSTQGNITSTGGLNSTKEINLSGKTITHTGEIHTDKFTVATDTGVKFTNTENTFNTIEIASRDGKSIKGSVEVTSKSDEFAPIIKNDVTGNMTVTNTKKGGLLTVGNGAAVNIGGNFTANSSGVLSVGDGGTINVGKNFVANSTGDFNYGSTFNAKEISINAQNIYRKPKTDGYLNATEKITFNNAKNLGTAELPILITNTVTKNAGLDITRSGGYIKGVNGGIFTLGNIVTDEYLSISSDGSIVQSADKNKVISVKKIGLSANGSITLDNPRNQIGTLVLNGENNFAKSSGAVTVKDWSQYGLTIEGDLKTSGNVSITAEKKLTLNGKIESDANVDLTSTKGDITGNGESAAKSGKQLTLKANDINISGKISSPKVDVTTGKGFIANNAGNEIKEFEITPTGDKINGAVSVTTNADEFSAKFKNDVAGDITLINKKSGGGINLDHDKTEVTSTNNNNNKHDHKKILRSSGSVGSTKEITSADNTNNKRSYKEILRSDGSITIEAGGKFLSTKPLFAQYDINVTSHNGAIVIGNETRNNVTLQARRDINLNSLQGVLVGNSIATTRNITINTQKAVGKDIATQASREAGRGVDISPNTAIGFFGNSRLNAGGNINFRANTGEIFVNGSISAPKGTVNLWTGKGKVNVTGKIRSSSGTTDNKSNRKVAGAFFDGRTGEEIIFGNESAADITINAGQTNISPEKNDAINSGKNITLNDGDINVTDKYNARNKIFADITPNHGTTSSTPLVPSPSSLVPNSYSPLPEVHNEIVPSSSFAPNYDFAEFYDLRRARTFDMLEYNLSRDNFNRKFVPTRTSKEFTTFEFDLDFDGMRNVTVDELTIA